MCYSQRDYRLEQEARRLREEERKRREERGRREKNYVSKKDRELIRA